MLQPQGKQEKGGKNKIKSYNPEKQASFQGSCGWGSLCTTESFKRNIHCMDRMWLILKILIYFLPVLHTLQQLRLALGLQDSSRRFWSGCACLIMSSAVPQVWSLCHRLTCLVRSTRRKPIRGIRENVHKMTINFPFCTTGDNNGSPPLRL